jgi:hypothetical protein
MLGFGGLRSFDKVKGVSNDVLPLTKATKEVAAVPEEPQKKKKILGVAVPPWL